MSLWKKTDAELSMPTWLTTAQKAKAVFVSAEEAVLGTNKNKGITGAGWWLIDEYTDSDGRPRYKTECLVALTVANATSGDAADDAKVADVEVTITVTAQPAAQSTSAGAATFGITASVNTGTLTYQWQKKTSTTRWVNVADATAATLVLSGQLVANTGDQYRVVLGSTSGAVKVTSDAATLTFVS